VTAALPDISLPEPAASRLLTPQEEVAVFHRVRGRLVLSTIQQTFARSRLRLFLVVGLTAVFWLGLFLLFFEGFQFLNQFVGSHGELHAKTIHFIFNAFYLSLMVMLVFSAAIIMYGALFRSEETDFLLTLPTRTERIVAYKFQEAVLFSCWGFLLLGSPMLVSYGLATGAPSHYYLVIAPFLVAFCVIPCAAGALACLAIAYWLPRVRLLAVVMIAVAALGFAGLTAWSVMGGQGETLSAEWFNETIDRLKVSRVRLLPSWWLSTGLLEAARTSRQGPSDRPFSESIFFLLLLISNALVGYMALQALGKRTLRRSYSALHGESETTFQGTFLEKLGRRLRLGGAPSGELPVLSKRSAVSQIIDRAVMAATFFLPYRVRLLIVKDVRIFRRDPVQWSQVLIFFGLLALYFLNVRRFGYDRNVAGWMNMVSFLNLAVVGLILSTFTTRFIYPMISLEGSRFWILGLLPIRRESILWGKFLFAVVGTALPATLLILLSDLMLRITPLVIVVHQLACVILCLGLSGIAVGLGAKMPDLREQSPSKIAAGFGGTLNLVVSALYIVLVVVLTALPCHFYVAADAATNFNSQFKPEQILVWIYIGVGLSVLLGLAATVIPMRIGFRAFRRLEF